MTTFHTPSGKWHLPERPQSRLIAGIVISLLIHGLILSLQVGIQGIGLPGLLAPWNDRRAPELSIRLTNAKPSPGLLPKVDEQPESTAVEALPIPLKKETPIDTSPVPEVTTTPPTSAWHPSLPPSPLKSEPSVEKPTASPENANPIWHPVPAKKESHQKVLMQEEPKQSTFVLPPEETVEAGPQTASTVESPSPTVEVAEKKMPDAPPAVIESGSSLKDQAAQKLAEEESRKETQKQAQESEKKAQADAAAKQLATEAKAKQQADEAAQQQAATLALQKQVQDAQKLKEEAAKQAQALATVIANKKVEDEKKQAQEKEKAEDILRKQAAALELQKQAAIKLAQEEATKRTLEIDIKKLAEAKKQAAENAERAERLALEREAEKKMEDALRRQAEIAAQKKQVEELAAKQREQELAKQREQERVERQKDEIAAARLKEQLKEQERLAKAATDAAAASVANTAQKGTDKIAGNGGLPTGISPHDLVSRALSQPRKNDLADELPARNSPSSGLEDTRRRTFLGGFDVDVGMKMYIESWRQKIERNGNLNYAQSSKEKARGEMIVNVVIRSDGSVDNVTIVHSSGRPELDDAVRRIVRLNARYSAFPPNLARQYDIVEIRRVWNFDDGLKLVEEVR